jgi:hypothetical protein
VSPGVDHQARGGEKVIPDENLIMADDAGAPVEGNAGAEDEVAGPLDAYVGCEPDLIGVDTDAHPAQSPGLESTDERNSWSAEGSEQIDEPTEGEISGRGEETPGDGGVAGEAAAPRRIAPET